MRKDGVFVQVVFPRPPSIEQGRAREANLITVGLAAICGLAGACGTFPMIERAASSFFVAIVVLTVIAVLLRWLARRVREHVEDLADARTADRWRAARAEAACEGRDCVGRRDELSRAA